MAKNSCYYRKFWICLALAVVTAAVYCQVCTYDFLNLDDPIYVYENSNIQSGLTPAAVKWAFTSGYASNWHPATWLSHILDWQLFGDNPAGHHITNLIFHIVNTLLLFIVLAQMTGALWRSAFVAALFALHPLHVESVAWIAERKDVLSAFFCFLTMWAYIRFVRQPKIWRYLLIVVFFVLGLMAKPMLVTLPFVLLLLDYWPLERIGTQRSLVSLLIEKIPLFVTAVASSIVTFAVQRKAGAMVEGESYGFVVRLANTSISYLQYIIKMFWPSKLAVFYPHPGKNMSFPLVIISTILLLAVTVVILRFSKKHRYLVTGWFWCIGTLVPVIGLVQVGEQAMADRYTYITLIGLFIIIAWGVNELSEKWRYKKIILTASVLMIILSMSLYTHFHLRYWRNTMTLSQHALDVTEDNYTSHLCMAIYMQEHNRIEDAVYHCREALRIKPGNIKVFAKLGSIFFDAGRLDEAAEEYQKFLRKEPNNLNVLNALGIILCRQDKFDEAVECLTKALKTKPDFAAAHANLAAALMSKGKFAEAVEHYKIAAETMDTPQIHEDFGYGLLKLDKFAEAVAEYRKALSANSNNPDILNKIGYALTRMGKFDEAVAHFNQALKIDPDYTIAKDNLAIALAEKQKSENTDSTLP